MAMWGGEPPFAYDDDEGVSYWDIAIIVAVFVLLAIVGVATS